MLELCNRIYEGDIDPSIAISRYEIFLKRGY